MTQSSLSFTFSFKSLAGLDLPKTWEPNITQTEPGLRYTFSPTELKLKVQVKLRPFSLWKIDWTLNDPGRPEGHLTTWTYRIFDWPVKMQVFF